MLIKLIGVILLLLYIFIGICYYNYIRIRAIILYKKLKCLDELQGNKIMLILIPIFMPSSMFKKILNKSFVDENEKIILEKYVKILKIFKIIYLIPFFICGFFVTFIADFFI